MYLICENRQRRHYGKGDEVAELTGVSKPVLGQIERGQSPPTINVLWKISTGLKIPLSFFCRQPETEYAVAGPLGKEMITEEDGGMRAYLLFSFDPARNLEVFLQKRQSIRFGADVPHAYHNVLDEVCTVYNVIFYPDN